MLKTPGIEPAVAAGSAGAGPPSTRRLAIAVWAEMQRRGVVPTPRNYMLWFTYRAGTNAGLNKRMTELLTPGRVIGADVLEGLYDDCLGGRSEIADAAETGGLIEDAARTLIEHLAGNQAAADGYGHVLAHWQTALGGECTQEGLLGAVTALVGETGRAIDRNLALQEQLAAATSRIARLRQSLAAVRQEAVTDALTGIANRKAFDDRLRRLIRQARSEPRDQPRPLAVLLFDIDHFKAFNDTYGHRTGDLVLRLVARVLADNVKGRDCAARYGGEEFGVILAGTDLHGAAVVARQISDLLANIRLLADGVDGVCHITVSTGVAQHRPAEGVAALVERADQALYEAKRRGRNQVCVAD